MSSVRLSDPGCKRCSYYQTAKNVCIPATGPLEAEILMVMDAPGEAENREGRGYVGDPGRTLQEGLREPGVDLSGKVRKAYLVRCRPPAGVAPSEEAMSACDVWMQRDIAAMPNLKVIVPLGKAAADWVLGKKAAIIKRAGLPIGGEVRGFECYPLDNIAEPTPA